MWLDNSGNKSDLLKYYVDWTASSVYSVYTIIWDGLASHNNNILTRLKIYKNIKNLSKVWILKWAVILV